MGRSQKKRSGSACSYNKDLLSASIMDGGVAPNVMKKEEDQKCHEERLKNVRQWMHLLLTARHDATGKSSILHQADSFPWLVAYLTLARKLDHVTGCSKQPPAPTSSSTCRGNNLAPPHQLVLQEQLLLERDVESQYTALHWAIYRADLASLLFLLRHAASEPTPENCNILTEEMTSGKAFQIRPMALLEYTPSMTTIPKPGNKTKVVALATSWSSSPSSMSLWQRMVSARDGEGFTPGQLLASLQRSELRACRASLQLSHTPSVSSAAVAANSVGQLTARQQQSRHSLSTTFDFGAMAEQDVGSELMLLHHHMRALSPGCHDDDSSHATENRDLPFNPPHAEMEYGCEVLTFGRAHHCALGVGSDGATSTTVPSASTANPTFRPQRVETFAQSEVGRQSSAVAVAAAAHHTLVLNRAGQVHAFGLGKGGRLGIGNHERHSSLPALVCFPNHRRCHVIAIAAAENHSLAVVEEGGQTYAWGSNRFGQLGISSSNGTASSATTASTSGSPSSCSFVPRRIDELKDVRICAVAAGERHSVALSSTGGVYVWGDNSSGQLGVQPRHAGGGVRGGSKSHKHAHSSSSSSHNPVQRVEHPALVSRTAVAIAASEYATLALTLPDGKTLPVNSIFAWGHGNPVPSKVYLPQHHNQESQGTSASGSRYRRRSRSHSWNEDESMRHKHHRLINPIAIACAKYHNVAISENGLVYSWGFHSETLGNTNNSHSGSASTTASPSCWRDTTPQLVTGMLPEQGGGLAVAVSASENHTAVVTDTGALYTWGATYGPNILGHEGVRWQPNPKRVPGLYRAVAVAAAKEHFVVLSGTTFPLTPAIPQLERYSLLSNQDESEGGDEKLHSRSSTVSSSFPLLEELAAQQVTKSVDLFNVWPILITAERVQSETLIRYCHEFCKRNLDGVLNVGQRRAMDCYLTEQLQTHGTFHQGLFACTAVEAELERSEELDAPFHPILRGFCNQKRLSSLPGSSSATLCLQDWMVSCSTLMQSRPGQLLLHKLQQGNAESSRPNVAFTRKREPNSNGKKKSPQPPSEEKEPTAFTQKSASPAGKTRRGVSFSDDRADSVALCGYPRFVELSSNNLDDDGVDNTKSPADQILWFEEREQALTKEIRALRKRLNQISKLVESGSASVNNGEAPDGVARGELLPEQHEKVGRQALLQADLNLLERASAKVNVRLEDLRRKDLPTTTSCDDKELPLCKTDSEGNSSCSKVKNANIRCDLCGITCSDESSYSLHVNGRKHRNRVTQAEQAERERKAVLVVAEQHQKELLKQLTSESGAPRSKPVPPSNPWKVQDPHLIYKLPPPPHGVPSVLFAPSSPTTPAPSFSLVDIMAAEEETLKKSIRTASAGCCKKMATARPTAAPARIEPSINASSSSSIVDKAARALSGSKKPSPTAPGRGFSTDAAPCVTKSRSTTRYCQHSQSNSAGMASWSLKVDVLPDLDSPPWASAPVAGVAMQQHCNKSLLSTPQGKISATAQDSSETGNSPNYLLGDYITKRPPAESTPVNAKIEGESKLQRISPTTKKPAWSLPGTTTSACPTSASSTPTMTTATAATLVQIQDEELAFKEKQDASCGGEGQVVWFVERRERAGSLKEIQRSTEKEREHRLLVEEQFRIEQQIREELERAKQQQEEQAAGATRKKNHKRYRQSHQLRRAKGRGSSGGGGQGGGSKPDVATAASAPVSSCDSKQE